MPYLKPAQVLVINGLVKPSMSVQPELALECTHAQGIDNGRYDSSLLDALAVLPPNVAGVARHPMKAFGIAYGDQLQRLSISQPLTLAIA